MSLLIFRLVKIFAPSLRIFLPVYCVGVLVYSLHISSSSVRVRFCPGHVSWSVEHLFFAASSHSTLMAAHMSKGPMWSYLCPFMSRHFHWIGDFYSLELIYESMSKLLEFQEKVVSQYISILVASIPLHSAVVSPSRTLCLLQIISTIILALRSPDSSLL